MPEFSVRSVSARCLSAPLWLAFCVLIAVVAETGRPGGADLVGPTFSELIFTDRGARLVGAAMLAAAFAVASVTRTLLDQGAPADRPATILLVGWVTAMAIAAVVPMTPVGAPFSWYDQVHRWVALAGLLCLPLAGLRLARGFGAGPRWRALAVPIRRTSWAGLVTLAAFVVVSLAPEAGSLYAYRGITERATLAADLVLVGLLAAAPFRSRADPPVADRAVPRTVG